MRAEAFARAGAILRRGIEAHAFPGATVEVGTSAGILWRAAFGYQTYGAEAPPAEIDTIYDLASLTKVLATTTLALRQVAAGRLALDCAVRELLPDWTGVDRRRVTIRHLLTHSAGLTAWLPLYRDHRGRREFQHTIAALPLEYAPGTRALYSDLGFILLGFILEDTGGAPLDVQFDAVMDIDAFLHYKPPASLRGRMAPTEVDPWRGRLLVGEVHDENTWALSGVAGPAGLFGTAPAVGHFARAWLLGSRGHVTPLASPDLVRAFIARDSTPESSRALGWDTMLPTSSCGTRMSPRAIGHTGFTGTSLWIDPEADVYVVLLTNRVHPSRSNERIRLIRPAFHDAVMDVVNG